MNMEKSIIPEINYNQEEREGFVISEMMKHCWAAQLKALSDISSICDENGIAYFAAFGTMLGTVRHKGFIPWDDDIDIGMLRDDYINFLDLFDEKVPQYEIYNPYTKSWYCMNFSHIVNGRDLSFTEAHLKKWHGCPFIVGPDIFPYYYIPRNPGDEKWVLHTLDNIDAAIALSRESAAMTKQNGSFDTKNRLNETLAEKLVALQNETGFIFDNSRPMENQLEILYDQVCRLTEKEDADYATRYDRYCRNKDYKFPIEWLEKRKVLFFEGMPMPVPEGYEGILSAIYGDGYMLPNRSGSAHNYPFFRKQLEGMGDCFEEREAELGCSAEKTGVIIPENRKVVLFHTNVRRMLADSEYAIDKIKQVLDHFRDKSEEYFIWWIPGRFFHTDEMALDMLAPDMIKDYEELIASVSGADYCLCDLSGDADRAAECCDLFFGDPGILSKKCSVLGRPVIIQDYKLSDYKF